jgi:hypothetical protein
MYKVSWENVCPSPLNPAFQPADRDITVALHRCSDFCILCGDLLDNLVAILFGPDDAESYIAQREDLRSSCPFRPAMNSRRSAICSLELRSGFRATFA